METTAPSTDQIITRDLRTELVKRFRSRIKDLAHTGKSLRQEARTLKGNERNIKHMKALHEGKEARLCLLVYGFLRFREYKRIEPNSRKSPGFSEYFGSQMRYWLISEIESVTGKKLPTPQHRTMARACESWINGDSNAVLSILEPTAETKAA